MSYRRLSSAALLLVLRWCGSSTALTGMELQLLNYSPSSHFLVLLFTSSPFLLHPSSLLPPFFLLLLFSHFPHPLSISSSSSSPPPPPIPTQHQPHISHIRHSCKRESPQSHVGPHLQCHGSLNRSPRVRKRFKEYFEYTEALKGNSPCRNHR